MSRGWFGYRSSMEWHPSILRPMEPSWISLKWRRNCCCIKIVKVAVFKGGSIRSLPWVRGLHAWHTVKCTTMQTCAQVHTRALCLHVCVLGWNGVEGVGFGMVIMCQ